MIRHLEYLPNLSRVHEALQRYHAARQELRKLGVLRSGRSVAGNYTAWLAATLFDLRLAKSEVQKGQ